MVRFLQEKVDDDGHVLDELELNTHGYDMRIPGTRIPMNKRTVIPEPERHFFFSTKMMIMAIDLYEDEAPASFCHFTVFALNKLRQFVDSRKELTAQSYRFFVEHPYNQFFQHEAFHQSEQARTKVKECGTGDFHTSTKLDGYIWISGNEKVKHIPESQTATVDMEDHDENADEELDYLPRLQVFVKPQEEKGVCSHEREETQPEEVQATGYEDALGDAAPIRKAEDRHGQFLLRQLKPAHQRLLHEITLTGQNVLRGDDLEGGQPLQRGEISYFSLLLMMAALAQAEFKTFMDYYAPAMGFEISYDDYHDFKLAIGKVLQDNEHITSDNFLDVEEPELVDDDDPETPLPNLQGQSRVDPEYKGTIESLNVENKHIILETDDDKLVECTLQWINMCNKHVQKKIKERVVKDEAKQEEEEEIEVEDEQQDTQEPHVLPGSSSEKEEPVPPERSSEKEESGERKQTSRMMKQLLRKNLLKDFTMVKISLETKMIQFFES